MTSFLKIITAAQELSGLMDMTTKLANENNVKNPICFADDIIEVRTDYQGFKQYEFDIDEGFIVIFADYYYADYPFFIRTDHKVMSEYGFDKYAERLNNILEIFPELEGRVIFDEHIVIIDNRLLEFFW